LHINTPHNSIQVLAGQKPKEEEKEEEHFTRPVPSFISSAHYMSHNMIFVCCEIGCVFPPTPRRSFDTVCTAMHPSRTGFRSLKFYTDLYTKHDHTIIDKLEGGRLVLGSLAWGEDMAAAPHKHIN
jgi:hypothetical protein